MVSKVNENWLKVLWLAAWSLTGGQSLAMYPGFAKCTDSKFSDDTMPGGEAGKPEGCAGIVRHLYNQENWANRRLHQVEEGGTQSPARGKEQPPCTRTHWGLTHWESSWRPWRYWCQVVHELPIYVYNIYQERTKEPWLPSWDNERTRSLWVSQQSEGTLTESCVSSQIWRPLLDCYNHLHAIQHSHIRLRLRTENQKESCLRLDKAPGNLVWP